MDMLSSYGHVHKQINIWLLDDFGLIVSLLLVVARIGSVGIRVI